MSTIQTKNTPITLTNPTFLSGCQLWMDGSDQSSMTLSGSTITAWRDKSGNSQSFTVTGTPTVVSASQNGNSSVSFDGSSYFQNSTLSTPIASHSSFVVFKFTTAGFYGLVGFSTAAVTGYDNSNAFRYAGNSISSGALTNDMIDVYANNSGYFLPLSVPTSNALIFYEQTTVNSPYPIGVEYYNGSLGAYTSVQQFNYTPATSATGIRIGGSTGNTNMIGNIYEVIVYTQTLTTIQRQQVEGYLAWKWGLQASLPTNHRYYNLNPLTASTGLPSLLVPKSTASLQKSFSPTGIAGCQLWMDAADSTTITRSGANITGWNDKANLYTGTATNNPQYNSNPINGLPTIHFDGASSRYVLLTANNFNYSFMTYCLAIRWVSGSGSFMGTDTPGNYGRALAVSSPNVQLLLYSQFYTTTVALTAGQPCILFAYFNGTTDFTVILNGTKTLFSVAQGSGNTNTNGFNIGLFNPTNGGNHSFDMGEGIVYNSILSDAQRQQVEGYLAWKWGIQNNLSTGNPYYASNTLYTPFPDFVPSGVIRQTSSKRFSPTSLASCAVWLDAAKESGVNGSSVTLISDRSGNGINMTSSATLSTNYLNGIPVYNLGTNVPTNSSFTWNSYFTQFVVVKGASPSGGWLVDIMDTSHNYMNYVYTGNWTLMAIGGFNDSIIPQGTSILTSTPGGVSAWAIFSIGYAGGATAANYTINGTVRSTTTATPSGQYNQTGTFYINGNYYGCYDTYSYFAEFIHYNSVLSDAQRQSVEGYLAWKWGLRSSLPGGHPYINFPASP